MIFFTFLQQSKTEEKKYQKNLCDDVDGSFDVNLSFDCFQWWRGEGTCSNSGWRKEEQKIEEKIEGKTEEKEEEDADKVENEEKRKSKMRRQNAVNFQ